MTNLFTRKTLATVSTVTLATSLLLGIGTTNPASAAAPISGRVFNDINSNGVSDSGEVGVPGVTVTVYDDAGAVIGTTTTGATGTWSVSGTDSATLYRVEYSNLQGYQPGPAGPGNGSTVQFVTGASRSNLGLTEAAPIEIGNRVWLDADRDGVQDPSEAPIAGVVVQLFDTAGVLVGTTTTDTNGNYVFVGVKPNTVYTIEIATGQGSLTGMVPTVADAAAVSPDGTQNDSDSDGVPDSLTAPTKVVAAVMTGAPGANDHTFDFGFHAPIPEATTTTTTTTTTVPETTTSTVAPATVVPSTVVPSTVPAGVTTVPVVVTVPVTTIVPTTVASTTTTTLPPKIDLVLSKTLNTTGAVHPGATVAYTVKVTNNGPGTAKAGFSVTDVLPGGLSFASVAATGTGYTCAAPVAQSVTCTSDHTLGVLSGTAPSDTLTINAVVGLTAAGKYANVAYVTPAPGDVTETNPLTVPTPGTDSSTTGTNNDGHADITVTPLYSVGNLVWSDTNNNGVVDGTETGVDGVTVNLLNQAGAVISTQQTTTGGYYLFTGLQAGDYRIEIVPPTGYISSTGTNGALSGPFEPAPAVSTATDSDDNGTATATTPAAPIRSSVFTLDGTQPTGEPETPGHTDPTVDTRGNHTVDFGIWKPASLGDTVWSDTDHDGIQDATETGVDGITVNLLDANGAVIASTTTDANGKYTFDNLTPGTYSVEFVKATLPAGMVFTTQGSGTDRGTDSNADTTTGRSAPVTLVAGERNPTIDAGIWKPTVAPATTVAPTTIRPTTIRPTTVAPAPVTAPPTTVGPKAAIGNYVWFDDDRDGFQDPSEIGVAGVKVTLLDGAGKVVASTVTNSTGGYLFDGLMPGDYQVVFDKSTLPDGFVLTGVDAGNDATDSDADSNGRTPIVSLAANERNMTIDAGLNKVPVVTPVAPPVVVAVWSEAPAPKPQVVVVKPVKKPVFTG